MSEGMNVRVFSYNVLSSHLPWGGIEVYSSCKAEYLDANYRLHKLLTEKLPPEIEQQSIICLQEVSHTWAGKLHAFFAQRGYYFIATLYGSIWSGYMGVGVAVPLTKYKIEDVDITRIADALVINQSGTATATATATAATIDVISKVGDLARQWIVDPIVDRLWAAPKQRQENVWQLAADRNNRMICVTLSPNENTGTRFIVGTYHIPCVMDHPAVMMIHCALTGQHIQQYALAQAQLVSTDSSKADVSLPYIFCGDFKVRPTEPMYQLMTTGNAAIVDQVLLKRCYTANYDCNWLDMCGFSQTNICHRQMRGSRLVARWSILCGAPIRNILDVSQCSVAGQMYVVLFNAFSLHDLIINPFWAFVQIHNEPGFFDLVDYIFISPEWTVVQADKLPGGKEDIEALSPGPLPNEHHPSDHLPVASNLQLSAPLTDNNGWLTAIVLYIYWRRCYALSVYNHLHANEN
jgi:mRNA deadenylase 3'-5' endonuclease subunit Ccr4